MTTAGGPALPKYLRVAAVIRRQIADGSLRPGQPAPSGAELSRAFGFSTLTCRKALRALIAEGLLVPGPSPNARPRVADPQAPDLERDLAHAARALSAGLAGRRHAAGLTQAELAELAGVSVTTVGHAETGRTWQSRRFWERADTALRAAGDLLRLHDAYRAASSPTVSPTRPATAPLPASPAHPFQVPPSPTLASQASPSQALAPLTPPSPTLASQTAPAVTGSAQLGPALTAPAQVGPAQAGIAEVDPSQVRSSRAEAAEAGTAQGAPRRVGPSPVGPSRIVIVWTDGSITTVHAPEVLAGPSEATSPDLER
jgi:DNA-binding transcriptional regulator YhcF (GntR family)/DNA-binding XRE family transcriptional regulator